MNSLENYKEELNSIHAPEALIMKTLNRVHEEERKLREESDPGAVENATVAEGNVSIENNSVNEDNNIINAENRFGKTENNNDSAQTNSGVTDSVVTSSYKQYGYTGKEDYNAGNDYISQYSQYDSSGSESSGKKSFASKYKKGIVTVTSLVAAAALLMLVAKAGISPLRCERNRPPG